MAKKAEKKKETNEHKKSEKIHKVHKVHKDFEKHKTKKVSKKHEKEKTGEAPKLETYNPQGPEMITEPETYSDESQNEEEQESSETSEFAEVENPEESEGDLNDEISATIIEISDDDDEPEISLPSKTTSELDDSIEKYYVKKIEAILFISARYLTMQELISLSDLNPIIIRECLDALKEKYDRDDMAMEIVSRGDGGSEVWKMDIRKEFANITNKLATGSSEFSKSEMETLGIIAYKQPVKQSVVIKIRSNKAYDHIKKFHDLGLIKKKKVGHTNELSLSDEFYDYFNLSEAEGKNFLKKHSEGESQDG